MGRSLALIICLAVAFALAWWGERTPPPLPANAPSTEFSAARAMADVEAIAARPHPIGSPANAAARDHLMARMTALGLAPQVQRTQVLRQRDNWIAGGTVENLVGVLPGADRSAPAVALMAHYDSVPGSPGAADDAAGTAAALEIVRAIKAEGIPARDVVVILTDGEESGLLGAQAFFDQHPLRHRIGFVINMEARGGAGRAMMFQTGAQNGATVDLFRKAAPTPSGNSLTVFMYEQMPNDTDFTVPKDAGIAGLNYAFIGSQFDYHSPTSTPANLDKGSLQHLGQEALAAARAAASAEALPAKTPNRVYANTFGTYLLAYPPAAGWGVLALAAALVAAGAWRARQARALAWTDIAKGAGAALYAAMLAAALLRLARQATGAGFNFLEQHYLLAQAGRWEAAVALLAAGALVLAAAACGRGRTRLAGAALVLLLGAACSAFGKIDTAGLVIGGLGAVLALAAFGRPAGVAGAWLGVLVTGFLAAVALQILAPTTAFLVAWPLAAAGLAAAITGLAARRSLPNLAILTVIGAFGAAWLLAYAHGLYLGLDAPEMLAAVVWLAALVLWPLAHAAEDQKGARLAALAVILLGVVAVGVVRVTPPWTSRHPQPTHVAYYVDPAAGRGWRISDAPALPDWTRGVLAADGGKVERRQLPGLRRSEVWAAPAPAIAAQPVQAALTRRPDGLHRLTIVAPAQARTLMLSVKPGVALSDAAVNGKPVKLAKGQGARIAWEVPGQGLTLDFRAAGSGTLEIAYAAVIDQWPADARPLPARPADLMAFGNSGATLVGGARTFRW